MTIRKRLTLRFTGLVASILLLTFVSIYAFCWYYISQDFFRRLERRASTTGDLLMRYRLDNDLVRQLSQGRKDQLPNQKTVVVNERDSVVFSTNKSVSLRIAPAVLASVRKNKRRDFQEGIYYASASRYSTASGTFVVVVMAENTYGDAFLLQLRWALAGLFSLIAGVTAFSGWLFAGDALRPMQQIDRVVNAIFPRNRDERLRVRRENDEISRLSTTINRMLDRVAESFRLQRMFVANVSHELKNPLTQISSQLEVSLLNQRDPEAYRQTIRSVLEDITNLSELTRELLQLSQVSQDDGTHLLTDVVRADELVWDIRDEVTAINPRYRVIVALGTLPDESDGLTLRGNRTLLATALKNLTENACKFSTNGLARVRVNMEPSGVVIDIQNEGDPIPAADLPYIFEPFYRSRQTADVRGYGIGLSLVERVVRLHGGQVSVQSAGGETVFTVELPRG